MQKPPFINKLFLACGLSLLMAQNLAPVAAHASEKAPAISQAYTADLIAGDTHVIHGPLATPSAQNQGFMNNPGIIVTSAGLVIIDPGSSVQVGEMVLKVAKTISDLPVVASLATHVHGDHWLGMQAIHEAYPEAKLYAHQALIDAAKDSEAQAWQDLMLSLTEGATAGTEAVIPDQAVVDGDTIKIGDKSFAIVHKGQAHTKTDIMIHVLEDDVYFLGDNAFNGRMGRMDDGSYIGLAKSLDAAIATQAAHYVPGHGQSGDTQTVVRYRTLMASMYGYVSEYYDEGMSDFEMKPLVVEKLESWHAWSDFNEAIGRLISIAVLEVEEHAFD